MMYVILSAFNPVIQLAFPRSLHKPHSSARREALKTPAVTFRAWCALLFQIHNLCLGEMGTREGLSALK